MSESIEDLQHRVKLLEDELDIWVKKTYWVQSRFPDEVGLHCVDLINRHVDDLQSQLNRQKHETRNPVDIQTTYASAATCATKLYEAKRLLKAEQEDMARLRQKFVNQLKIVKEFETKSKELEALVNEKSKDYRVIMIFWIMTLIALGIAIYK